MKMTNEDSTPQLESFPCGCGNRFERLPSGYFACPGCGKEVTSTGRSLKNISRQFLDQPIDFKQLEAKGWPGPYVEYTATDAESWETLNELERKLFPELFPDAEESD